MQVAPKVAPRCENRCWIEQRWKKEKQDQVRIEPDNWKERNETQDQPAKDEQDGVRNLQPIRDHHEGRDQDQQEYNRLGVMHGTASDER